MVDQEERKRGIVPVSPAHCRALYASRMSGVPSFFFIGGKHMELPGSFTSESTSCNNVRSHA